MNKDLSIVFNICLEYLGSGILEDNREQDNVFKRSIYYKIARDLTECSLKEIGEPIPRDHATVLHGLKVFDSDIMKRKKKSNYLVMYLKLKERCEIKLKKSGYVPLDRNEKLLHTVINQRERIFELEKLLANIPKTIKAKYA